MRKLCFAVFLFSGLLAYGQQSLTVTASRSISAPADVAVFSISVSSGFNAGLDDVLAAVAGSGITAANLVTVNSFTSQQNPTLQWMFQLAVPFSKIKDTITALSNVQQALMQKKSGFTETFNGLGTQVSSQQCPLADLIGEARAQAQKIAAGTGVNIGPILAVSDESIPPQQLVNSVLPVNLLPASRIGDFFIAVFLFAPIVPAPATLTLNCAIAVKFSVLPSQ